jgi:monoamine oxidase
VSRFNLQPSRPFHSTHCTTAKHAHLFRPPLPANKRAAIDDIGFDSLNKVFFVFDRKFWDDEEYIQLGAHVDNYDNTVGKLD